jgi:hypothetical protein
MDGIWDPASPSPHHQAPLTPAPPPAPQLLQQQNISFSVDNPSLPLSDMASRVLYHHLLHTHNPLPGAHLTSPPLTPFPSC